MRETIISQAHKCTMDIQDIDIRGEKEGELGVDGPGGRVGISSPSPNFFPLVS
jgi:hypothetical protein